MSTSSFGSWYDEQRAAENGDAGGPSSSSSFSSWLSIDSEQVLPLFNSENLQGFSIESMKQSMEGSMPKKILGMGYQQRFKVSSLVIYFFFFNDGDIAFWLLIACVIYLYTIFTIYCLSNPEFIHLFVIMKRYFVHYYSCRLYFLH